MNAGNVMRFTIDSSVWINAELTTEIGHSVSRRFIQVIRSGRYPVVLPNLALVEITATLSRAVPDDLLLGVEFSTIIRQLPSVQCVMLDTPTTDLALTVAAMHRLRGADAVDAAVALRYGCTLVSLDREHLTRSPRPVSACTPADALLLMP